MLRRLSVKNFRLLRDVTIDIEPGKPIVLIGPNSSGKSSVLQVLDLLSRWVNEGFEAGCKAYGGVREFVTVSGGARLKTTIEVETDLFHAVSDEGPFVRYGIELDLWTARQEWLHDRFPKEPGRDSWCQRLGRQKDSFWVLRRADGSKIERTLQGLPGKLALELSHGDDTFVGVFYASLSRIHIYDGFLTTPPWVRDVREGRLSPFDSAVLSPVPRIDRRGLEMINALYHMQMNHHDEWEELIAAFQAEFPFVQRLEFPADPAGGRIALGWRDQRYPGVRMLGHQMSEGMTAYLCLLAAVLSPEPTPALGFDEPDAHLHPSALRRIVHLLEKASERTAIIITTHSDRLLDHLSDPAGSLRICEPSGDGITIRKIDREALEAWRKDYSLRELRERGHLDPTNAGSTEP